jgi:hypothetical protein
MSVPNIGPELPDRYESDDSRRGNPAMVYRDERPTDEVEAASTRASSVTHRFGGIRYGLSRPAPGRPESESGRPESGSDPTGQPDGGESDPQD